MPSQSCCEGGSACASTWVLRKMIRSQKFWQTEPDVFYIYLLFGLLIVPAIVTAQSSTYGVGEAWCQFCGGGRPKIWKKCRWDVDSAGYLTHTAFHPTQPKVASLLNIVLMMFGADIVNTITAWSYYLK